MHAFDKRYRTNVNIQYMRKMHNDLNVICLAYCL